MFEYNQSRRRVPLHSLVIAALVAFAPLSSPRAETTYQWAGFGTLGVGILDDNSINQLNGLPRSEFDEDWAADVDSRLGFQGTASFNDRLSATVQLVADSAEDELNLEWAYIAYDISQNARLRIGRLRRPLFALTDVLPVGYVYPWARPPVEVYSDIGIYDAIDAIDLIYEVPLGDWNLSTEVYYGGYSGEGQIARDEDGDYELRDDRGIVLQLEQDWLTLRFGYHSTPDFDIEESVNLQGLFAGLEAAGFASVAEEMSKAGLEGDFISLSAHVDYNDWLVNAEVVDIPVEGGAVPVETSWYLMGGRRIGSWTYSLTYAERRRTSEKNDFSDPIYAAAAQIPDFAPSPFAEQKAQLLALAGGVDAVTDGFEIDQHSYTLGLRYDFDEPVSIKTEVQRIEDKQFDQTNNLFSLVVDFLF